MSDLASELFGTVSQGDTDGHPLAGLENHPYFQQQAATTTTSESVADRPTTRQITVTLPTLTGSLANLLGQRAVPYSGLSPSLAQLLFRQQSFYGYGSCEFHQPPPSHQVA
jgi:hypothetical protein